MAKIQLNPPGDKGGGDDMTLNINYNYLKIPQNSSQGQYLPTKITARKTKKKKKKKKH